MVKTETTTIQSCTANIYQISLCCERSLIRALSLRRDTSQVPSLPILPVNNCAMLCDSVIPHNHRASLPLDADLEVSAVRQVVVKELEKRIRLLRLQADDAAGDYVGQRVVFDVKELGLTLRVHVEGFFSCSGMRAYNWVVIDHRFPSLDTSTCSRSVNLLNARMRRLKTVQALLEQRAQSVISLRGIDKQCIATSIRSIENVQKRSSRRLLLVRDIRVPRYGACPGLKEGLVALLARTTVHEVDLRVTFW